MADEFFLPEAFLRRNGIHPDAVQSEARRSALNLVPRMYQIRTHAEARDLAYRLGGRSAKPTIAPRLLGKDGTPIILAGLGVTEAAELEDIAIEAMEKKEAPINFAQSREDRGLPQHGQFLELLQEAAEDYVKRKKRTSRTDPAPPLPGQHLRGLVPMDIKKEFIV